jgi:hypothetical protein
LKWGFNFFKELEPIKTRILNFKWIFKNWNCEYIFNFGRKLLELRANQKLTAGLGPGYPELNWNQV